MLAREASPVKEMEEVVGAETNPPEMLDGVALLDEVPAFVVK